MELEMLAKDASSGHAAAVLISSDGLAALEEIIGILAALGALAAIAEGIADADAGRFADCEIIRAMFQR